MTCQASLLYGSNERQLMAGRPPEVDHTRDDLCKEINSARSLISSISALPQQVHPNAPQGIHPRHTLQVVELAFMGMVASWEEFLERALVRYVAGAKAKNGYAPTPKFGLANNISHSYEILSGNSNYNPAKHYLKVTDTKWIRNTADYIFKAHSFGILQTNSALMDHAVSIRNRVAHSSEKCRADFKLAAVHFLQPPNGQLVQGYMPGKLLLSPVTRHFPRAYTNANITHFEAYARLFESMAEAIVPK